MAIVRGKNPEADLKLKYKRVFWICAAISFAFHSLMVIIFPTFDIAAAARRKDQVIIQMEDIPETQQIKRPPPPPRPAEPIETESEDVPDDLTIESTDLDFDEAFVDMPPPPPPGGMEEEIMEFWKVEQKPVPIKTVAPVYPNIARKAEIEGRVFVQFVVGTDGRVRNVRVLKGPEIFRQAAIDAVKQFVFQAAVQNDKPVQVQMVQPINFTLRK